MLAFVLYKYIPPVLVCGTLVEIVAVLGARILDPAKEANGANDVKPDKISYSISILTIRQDVFTHQKQS